MEAKTLGAEMGKHQQYLYLYGIINNDDIKLDIKGLKNISIKKINFKDISALTSSYPTLKLMLKEIEY